MDEKPEPTRRERFKQKPVVAWGDRSIDLSPLKPFTLGDKKKLQTEFGINFGQLREGDTDEEIKMVFFILRMCCPDLKIEEMEDLTIAQSQMVMEFAGARAYEIDHPSSARSISSPAPTAGA